MIRQHVSPAVQPEVLREVIEVKACDQGVVPLAWKFVSLASCVVAQNLWYYHRLPYLYVLCNYVAVRVHELTRVKVYAVTLFDS